MLTLQRCTDFTCGTKPSPRWLWRGQLIQRATALCDWTDRGKSQHFKKRNRILLVTMIRHQSVSAHTSLMAEYIYFRNNLLSIFRKAKWSHSKHKYSQPWLE